MQNLAARTRFKNLIANENGGVMPIASLTFIPMFMFLGIAIDQGRQNSSHTQMQNALDAGAIAALKAGPDGAEEAGIAVFKENYRGNLSDDPVLNFTFIEGGGMRATARGSVDTSFARIFGISTVEVATTSLVQPKREVVEESEDTTTIAGNVPCLHVMDQSSQRSFELRNNTNLDANDCDARVRSNRSEAMYDSGSTNVQFKRIDVKGDASVSSGLQITTAPFAVNTDAAVVGSPFLAGIRDVAQSLSVGKCTNANTGKVWAGSLQPGVYCGATEFKNATFAPGIYIIKSGSGNKSGALKLTGSLDGSAGVTFYFADNKSQLVSYTGTSGSVLRAPTSGITQGILFFENSNRGNRWDVTLETLASQSWQGLVYLPSANMVMRNISNWPQFNVSVSAHTLLVEGWQDMTWNTFAWTPFNQSNPIRYDDENGTTTTVTVRDKPLHIAE